MVYLRTISLIISLSFLLGYLAGSVFTLPIEADVASPLTSFFTINAEQASPHNWISEDDIFVGDDKVIIHIDDPYWSKFANTNSMDPLLDEDANAIQIIPQSVSDIHIGDIISYQAPEGIIIHRVVSIASDESGWYAMTKGDNNAYADAQKVRFDQIERVLVAVIY